MDLSQKQDHESRMKQQGAHIVIIVCLVLGACSPSKRFGVLSFFFDGVPDPNKSAEITRADSLNQQHPEGDTIQLAMVRTASVNYHDPYQKKRCMECHDKNAVGELKHKEPKLCYSCHDNYSTKYDILHSPVDFGFCLVCHEPHMSKNRNLLRTEGNALCIECHVSYKIKQPDTHVEIGTDLCSKCHDPHGEHVE